MVERTAGHAAREMAMERGVSAGTMAWDALPERWRQDWEAVAQAACAGSDVTAELARLRAERDEARAAIRRMLDVAREWDLKPGYFAQLVTAAASRSARRAVRSREPGPRLTRQVPE